jgi:murein DD-endopeptidase MepM/ murein hydrolase activator NlpD
VKAGDVIALTGRTGRATTEHLHFETRINGRAYDPSRFFDHQAHTIRMKAFQKTKNGYVVKK